MHASERLCHVGVCKQGIACKCEMLIIQAWHLGAEQASSLPGSCPQLPWGCLTLHFPNFPAFSYAPRMTHLWWHQCHCSPATAAQNHLFCHFPLSFRSVSAVWVQHCWHSSMVQKSLLSMSLLSIPTGSRLSGCCDAQSMPSFLQMASPVEISVMLPLISTGSSRPAWTEGRSWCFWTKGSKGELLCPASHREGMQEGQVEIPCTDWGKPITVSEWFGWEGTLKLLQSHGQGHLSQPCLTFPFLFPMVLPPLLPPSQLNFV